jgi:DNA-binding response OmpR family regulator
MTVVLLTGDLAVASRVEGAARMWGETVRTYASASQALSQHSWDQAKLLIVDLATPSIDVKALVESLRQTATPRPRIVAFGPHVQSEWLAAAREAGCEEVMSRGEFFARVNELLQGLS